MNQVEFPIFNCQWQSSIVRNRQSQIGKSNFSFMCREAMQHFDGEIAKLVRSGALDLETGISYASNATVLGQELAR